MIMSALPGFIGAYYSIKNNTDISKTEAKVAEGVAKVEKGDEDRQRIEGKIDRQHTAAVTAVEVAKVAVTAAEETKAAIEETKTVVQQIKAHTDTMNPTPDATPKEDDLK